MSGVLCEDCQGIFLTSEHPCGVKLAKEVEKVKMLLANPAKHLLQTSQERDTAVVERETWRIKAQTALKEVEKLNLELMERDTRPDFERGEYAGQDAMMRHLEKMDQTNNSAMATAVKRSPYVQGLLRFLAQHGDSLDCASYSSGQAFDPEAAKAFHSEFCITQKRCELWSKDLVQDDG